MFKPNSLIIYVEDVAKSTDFYQSLLKTNPIEKYEEFSVFELTDGFILGLQSKAGIDPKPQPYFGGFEMSMSDVTNEQVDTLFAEWTQLGVKFELLPTVLEFGYTFVAIDPDGHRLRVCATDTLNIS